MKDDHKPESGEHNDEPNQTRSEDVNLKIGNRYKVNTIFIQEDFDRFAALTGDNNPIHTDPAFSARSRFGKTVAHGMLLYSKICQVLGTKFPGPGTVQLEQDLMFPAPTYVGEQITIYIEVIDYQPEKGEAELLTQVQRPDGSLGLDGRTVVHLPSDKNSNGAAP
jgi:3-hydroxybutyryl-CoA dehydratase